MSCSKMTGRKLRQLDDLGFHIKGGPRKEGTSPMHTLRTRLTHTTPAHRLQRTIMTHYQDVLSSFAPEKKLHVQFPEHKLTQEGQQLTTHDTQRAPAVCWDADDNEYHTLAMVDPDAPSRNEPKFGEWRHWLVINIPGSKVNQGEVLTPYMGPTPPAGTGLHRYVFVLFKQNDMLEKEQMNNEGKGRANFKIESWAKKHNLRPLSATYFVTKHD